MKPIFYLFLTYMIISRISGLVNINVFATGLYLPYSLGVLGYIKNNIDIPEYKLTGTSGGSWISLMYCLEDDLSNHETIWNYTIQDNDYKIKLNSNLEDYIENVSKNLIRRYKNIDDKIIKSLPLSIISTKLNKIPENVKISKFDNIEDIIEYCVCSSYIPFVSGKNMCKKYKEFYYIDGDIFKNKKNINTPKPTINIHKKMWGRKFNIYNSIYSDYNTSEKLFKYGWEDTEKNIDEIKRLIK